MKTCKICLNFKVIMDLCFIAQIFCKNVSIVILLYIIIIYLIYKIIIKLCPTVIFFPTLSYAQPPPLTLRQY